MEIEVLDKEGNRQKSIKVSSANFDAEFNSALVHQVVVAYRAAFRAGTHAQKNRSRVRGGGAKPFRQSEGRHAQQSAESRWWSDIRRFSPGLFTESESQGLSGSNAFDIIGIA